MKLGISTSCFYPLETEKAFSLIAKQNVDCCEIFFNADCELKKPFIKKLKKIKDESGITVTSIHPTMSLAESFMLFSAYDRRLKEGLDNYKRYGEIAAELGADFVIMHGGKDNGVLSEEQYCERYLQISESTAEGGGRLLQENVANFRAGSLDFLKMMVKNLGNQARFCLDVKQSIRGGYTPEAVIDAVGRNIDHLHISDHNSLSDCQLPLRADYDFKALFEKMKAIGYSGSAIIEVYSFAYKEYKEIFESYNMLKDSIK